MHRENAKHSDTASSHLSSQYKKPFRIFYGKRVRNQGAASLIFQQAGVTGYSDSDHALFLVKGFVRRLYVNVLGREPDQVGMDYWSDGLFKGVASASDIVPGFFLVKNILGKTMMIEHLSVSLI